MKYLTLVLVLLITGCSSIKYPGWVNVRVITDQPPKQCEYLVQQACPPFAREGCINWYKKRASKYGANIVHMDKSRLIADYFLCEVKNDSKFQKAIL